MKSDIIKDVVSDIDIQIVRGKDVFVRTLRSGLGSLSLSLCLLIFFVKRIIALAPYLVDEYNK